MQRPVPEKALRRQATLIPEIVADIDRSVGGGTPADVALKHLFRAHPEYGSRDRALFSESVFSFFRWRGWVGALPGTTGDLKTACVLAHMLDAAAIHPAIAYLAEDTGLRGATLEPLGTLDLAGKAERLSRLFPHPGRTPAQLVPEWVPECLGKPDEGDADAYIASVLASFQTRPPTWLRIKSDTAAAAASLLAGADVGATRHPRIDSAVSIRPGANLRGMGAGIQDMVEVQDLASQAVGIVCAPSPGSAWWDACGGSGGKAFHLADLMGGRGRILATDIRAGILDQLQRRESGGKARIILARVWDGARDPLPEEFFDGVLVDAPCSGLGTWHRNPDARWRLPATRIGELAALQSQLLKTCSARVKRGGALVYATCTLTREENEMVARRFSGENPEFQPADFIHPLSGLPCRGQCRILPGDGPCNGMYVARWTRSP